MGNYIDGQDSEFTAFEESISEKVKFGGAIASASDFPTTDAPTGELYIITANVTDNDPTKTNTGQSFLINQEIVWNGTTWTMLGTTVDWYGFPADLGTLTGTDSVEINPNNGGQQKITVDTGAVITVTYDGFSDYRNAVLLKVVNGGDAGSINWGVATQFPGGEAPTLQASGTDFLMVWKEQDDVQLVGPAHLAVATV